MKYKAWERELKKELATISKTERDRTIEFYREMKDEKLSRGQSEEEITAEFGSPRECARRVGQASGATISGFEEEETPLPEKKSSSSPMALVGMILVLPLLGAAIGVLVAFAACCAAGIGVAIAGIAYATVGPFLFGATGSIIPAYVGMGLAGTGVGLLVVVGFMLATKAVATAIKSLLSAVFVRR